MRFFTDRKRWGRQVAVSFAPPGPHRASPRWPWRQLSFAAVLGGLNLLAASLGCTGQPAPSAGNAAGNAPDPGATAIRTTQDAVAAPTASTAMPAASPRAPVETWDAVSMNGARVGYIRTVVGEVERRGESVVQITSTMQLNVNRFGDSALPGVETTTFETLDGRIVAFESRLELSNEPTVRRATVDGERAEMQVTSGGRSETVTLTLPAGTRGPLAVEESLFAQPLRPGETRKLAMLDPGPGYAMQVVLVAKDFENTKVLDNTERLLRVEVEQSLPGGGTMSSLLWVDERGTTRKAAVGPMELVRTTREEALRAPAGGKFDLGLATLVHVERPADNPHAARLMRYRVRLRNGDPAKVFAAGATQQVERIDDHTAEVAVRALRPEDALPDGVDDEPPGDDDRRPNGMIQSDDERVRRLAAEAAGDETDPWSIALTLERHVRRTIVSRNFSTALASAAEVAETREGDCTEHAVLLAALCRARDIPARVAFGLVYVEAAAAFGYHMWTEAYIGDRWIPLDATLGQGGIGGGHLKLAHSNFNAGEAYSSFVPVVEVLGQLEIEVIED